MMRNRMGWMLGSTLALLLLGPLGQSVHAQNGHHDAEQIRSVIMSAYIHGLQSNGSREDIRQGFHPDFVMKVLGEGAITNVTIEEWIGRLPPEGQAPNRTITADIPTVDVAGDAAVARVEVHYDGDHVFTDYMSLYRFPEGWRIVAKIFHSQG
ncbi:MAG: hypothetical protein HKO53_09070 [Gemmatimonadetes bacterium]|nr:hypothetical protein [Gemmatimonadota bacterium]NNM33205.1 hypothetical protein [Gemmatimonadota bacterium]